VISARCVQSLDTLVGQKIFRGNSRLIVSKNKAVDADMAIDRSFFENSYVETNPRRKDGNCTGDGDLGWMNQQLMLVGLHSPATI
jgi:hypothetical protein